MKKLFFFLIGSVICFNAKSQSCSNLNITHQADIASTCAFMVMTMMHDELGRPYLYVANKEAGLTIYDISSIAAPSLVATVPINLYDSLHVMNLSQSGNYLYLAIGNHFNNTQPSGIAIVDVTNPLAPTVTNFWTLPSSTGGSGIVKVEGNYAYLGAMMNGLVILDISNKTNIQFVSQFKPDINWPVNNPNANLYNARGMVVKNSIVYLCFDAGGLRIIDYTNKSAPRETGHWCNPAMYSPLNHPKAYNNIVLDDTLAYIAVDYAGMEVVNISDTSNIALVGWWNPYNAPSNNWFTSPVHANEIHYDSICKHIFLSTGKSDMHVIDVTNPASPDSCNFYGGVSNNIGTWGVGLYQNQIYLSYACATFPFSSNWTGVKILTYTPCATGVTEQSEDGITVFPSPAKNNITVESKHNMNLIKATITNILGQTFVTRYKITTQNHAEIDVSDFSSGCYFLRLEMEGKTYANYFVKE